MVIQLLANGFIGGFIGTILFTSCRFMKHSHPDLPGVLFLGEWIEFENKKKKNAWSSLSHYVYGSGLGITALLGFVIFEIIAVESTSALGFVLLAIWGVSWGVVVLTIVARIMIEIWNVEATEYQGCILNGVWGGVLDHAIWGFGWAVTIWVLELPCC